MAEHEPPCGGPGDHVTNWNTPSCTGHIHVGPDAEPERKAREGTACRKAPCKGQKVCERHGGATRQAKAAAVQRLAIEAVQADAKKLLAYRSDQPITDPIGELARLASEVIAFKDAIAARLNALDDIRYKSNEGSEQLRVEVAIYERALDRTGKFLEVLVRSNFEERMARLEEQKVALVVATIRGVLEDLNLTPEQVTLVDTVVPARLRLLSGGAA